MRTVLVITALFISSASLAQLDSVAPVARNTVFVELGGMGFLYSFNYDHLLTVNDHFRTSLRGGLTAQWWDAGAVGIPLAFNGLLGKGKHFAELGVGSMYSYGIIGEIEREGRGPGLDKFTNFGGLHFFGQFGYRLQKPEGGFFLRATYTPWLLAYTNSSLNESPTAISHWLGISLGHTFR